MSDQKRLRRLWSPDARALGLIGDKFVALIVLALVPGPLRLTQLQRKFSYMSTGAIEQRLHRMTDAGLITRERIPAVPPRVTFTVTDMGRDLMPVIAEMAKWGRDWVWSAPREDEAVSISAIFERLPLLLDARGIADGTIQLIVTDFADGEQYWKIIIRDGTVSVSQGKDPEAMSTIIGTEQKWIAALSPDDTSDRLMIGGNIELACQLLASMMPASSAV